MARLFFLREDRIMHARFPATKSPFKEALRTLIGKRPPAFVRGYSARGYTDAELIKLQDWCATNARPAWATGLSMIEAAELIVAGAVENNNIHPEVK